MPNTNIPDIASLIRATLADLRHGRARPGHPRLGLRRKDVDARHKAGHDRRQCLSLVAQAANMDWFLPLIAGLGIGSIIKSIADHFMSRRASDRDRWYQEKRDAYTAFLLRFTTQPYVPPMPTQKLLHYGKRNANCSAQPTLPSLPSNPSILTTVPALHAIPPIVGWSRL
jgi:hypothetical protein